MERPTSVLVIAIINLCWAGLGLVTTCCGGLMLIPVIMGSSVGPGQDALAELWRDSLAFRLQTIIGTPIGLAILAALIAGAIGMLNGRAWGRTLTLVWAGFSIFSSLVGAVLQLAVIMPVTTRHQPAAPNVPPQLAHLTSVITYFSVGCGLLLGVGYAVLVIVLLNRPHVVAYFRRSEPTIWPQ